MPIFKQDNKDAVLAEAQKIKASLSETLRVFVDTKDDRPGAKFYEWELKGVPLRIELGSRDLANQECTVYRRIDGEKITLKLDELVPKLELMLQEIQQQMFNKAQIKSNNLVKEADKLADFADGLITGHAYRTNWCGNAACEKELKKHQASIRCILQPAAANSCFACPAQGKNYVLIGRSY